MPPLRHDVQIVDYGTPPSRHAPLPPDSHGVVELRVLVGIDGHARQVTIAKSDPPGVFDTEAVDAAKRSYYAPQMKDGRPVEGWITVPMRFETRSEVRTIQR